MRALPVCPPKWGRPPPRDSPPAGGRSAAPTGGEVLEQPQGLGGVEQTPMGHHTCWVMSGALSLRAACGWWCVGSPPSPTGCAGGFLLPTPSPAWFKNCCLESGSPPARPPRASEQGLRAVRWWGEEMRSEPPSPGRGAQALGDTRPPCRVVCRAVRALLLGSAPR